MKQDETAFPIVRDGYIEQTGLSKREYFAGLAMQGVSAAGMERGYSGDTIAEFSVKCADALLKALDR